MTGWQSVHIHYHDDPRDLLLDAVQPLFSQVAPHADAYFMPHWRQGPHLRLHVRAPGDVFRDVVSPLVHDRIGGYLRTNPSRTVLDPATVLDSHRRLAELEQDPGPLLPWPANNTVLDARYDRRLHMLGSVAAADLLADFHLMTTALAFDVLQLRRQGRQLPAIAFDLLIATAEALCGADLSWSFVSFRSHAEAFLSTWPEGGGLRPAWDGYFAANADRLTARAEAVAAAVHHDGGDALAQRWVRTVKPFRDRAGALVDAGMITLDPPPEARAEHAALSAQLGQASAFHAATADSPEFEAHVRDTVWFAQHRLMLNYLYLFLTRVGLTPSERFLLCHVAANTAERLHGVSAVDTARRSPTGASMGRLVPGLRPSDEGPSQLSERLALRLGVHGVTRENGQHHLVSWPRAEPLGVLDDGQRAVLWRLSAGGCDPSVLAEIAADHASSAPVDGLVDRLRERGWLAVTVLHDGVAQYTVVPKGNWWPVPPVERSGPLTLSRFAVMRRDHNGLQLTSPRSPVVVRIHAAQIAALVAGPLTADSAGSALPDRLAADLARAGLLVGAGDVESFQEAQWSPHELWFHDGSRQSYERAGSTRFSHFGATLWAKDRFPPLPGRPVPMSTRTVALVRPDLTRLHKTDPTLTGVLEGRRSIRAYDESSPVTINQLGELLFRCARVRSTDNSQGWDTSDRPYPAGGAVHELELYLVVRSAAGLEPGMYHYDAFEHQLEALDAAEPPRRRLLQAAARAMGAEQPPQVLILIAARFGRLMWKYESMPLALILKHVGVLTQTLYTVATAMRLAPCAVEAGDTDAFAQATGHDRLTESSVGEFCLGSAPPSEEPPCT